MSSYGQFCPISRALDVLGERWTLLIVRDLLTGVAHFNELARGLPRTSRALLVKRLRTLEDAGVVERHEEPDGQRVEYRLTRAGEELRPLIDDLMRWGARWAFGLPDPTELDPVLLMWWTRRRVIAERLPRPRTVVQFDFRRDPETSYWLILDPDDVSVCFDPPPFDIDLWVEADLSVFYRVWLGALDFHDAVAQGGVTLHGPPSLERAFPGWLAWSPAADTVRAVAGT